jgi:hypothetical protein
MSVYYRERAIPEIAYTKTTIIQGGGSSSGNGLDFTELGYPSTPYYIQEAFDYAKEIKENFPEDTNLSYKWQEDKKLVYFPAVDMSSVNNLFEAWRGCENLEYLPALNTWSCTNFHSCLLECTNLRRVEYLDLIANVCTHPWGPGFSYKENRYEKLRYVMLDNIGSSSVQTAEGKVYTLNVSNLSMWGIPDDFNPDARQSLIDSLITKSKSVKHLNLFKAEIYINENTYNLLTASEISQIENKGYTLDVISN